MSHLTNLAFFHAKPGQAEALGKALQNLVEPSRSDAGNLRYDLHQSIQDDGIWFVYEIWRSADDLDAHMRTPQLKVFLAMVPELNAGDIDLRQFTMVSKSPL